MPAVAGRGRTLLASACLAAGLASTAGCGTPGPGGRPASTPSRTATPSTSGSPTRLDIGPSSQGSTVHLGLGGRLRITLPSTYWGHVATSAPAVLGLTGTRTRPSRAPGCVPGQGCGAVVASFVALRPGTAEVSARRRLCGEDVLCPPAERRFWVRVVVR